VRHISRVNCTKITTDRPRQAAHKNFSIERRFQGYKSQPSRFKETCTQEHQRAESSKSCYSTVVRQSSVKRVQIGCLSQQALVTSFLVVSTSMTLKDPELPK